LIKTGWASTAMSTRLADHKRRHETIEDTDAATASVSLRPRSQRRVVPESLIAPRNRRDGNDTSSTASQREDEEEAEVEVEGGEKKQRFVWTPDLHHRFEIAVHKLGVANAKPQAIQQLMGSEEDGTIPTRQNIKSHLQKYRLRTGHRSESGRSTSSSGVSSAGGSQAGGSQVGGFAAPSQAPLDPIAQKQQTGLIEQLELQKKLDAQLLQQRNTQSALDLRMHTAGPGPTLRPEQLQRLARHVLIMRGMLQHLLTLLHAITVDFCAAGQFAQRSFASGPTQSEDEDECSSFETLMTTSAQSGTGPMAPMGERKAPPSPASMGQLGLPQIDCTPLQSDRDEFDSYSSHYSSHQPLPSADAGGEPASAEAMAATAVAITSLAAYQRERAKLSQQIGAAQEALPRVLDAQQARAQLAQAQAQQQAQQQSQQRSQQLSQQLSQQQARQQALAQQLAQQQAQQQAQQRAQQQALQQAQQQALQRAQQQQQHAAAARQQEALPGMSGELASVAVKLEPRVQALAPVAGERSSWPEPTAAAAAAECSSDAAVPAAQAATMPVCIGEKSWADRDAEARCSAVDVEAESTARASAADAPAAARVAAGAMLCEQQAMAMAMAAGVIEESMPLAAC